MRGLSATDVLAVWERGRGKRPVERALELLSAAFPEKPREELERSPIGLRDTALLALREATLGPRLEAVVQCPGSRENLELSLAASDIRVESDSGAECPTEALLQLGEYELRLRPPNSVDLMAACEGHLEEGSDALFRRCLISATRNGAPTDELTGEIVKAAGEKMTEVDPQTNVQLRVSCASCGHAYAVLFDIASFFWTEIEACAVRLLGEIHSLASAYGWTEREILALSPLRRQVYLEAVRS